MITDIKHMVHRSAGLMKSVDVFHYNVTDSTDDNYVTFYIWNNTETDSDTGSERRDVQLQFNVFSKVNDNGDTAESLAEEVIAIYKDWQNSLSVTGGLKIYRVTKPTVRHAAFADNCWQVTLLYTIGVESGS